jgi:hypothetical protein
MAQSRTGRALERAARARRRDVEDVLEPLQEARSGLRDLEREGAPLNGALTGLRGWGQQFDALISSIEEELREPERKTGDRALVRMPRVVDPEAEAVEKQSVRGGGSD